MSPTVMLRNYVKKKKPRRRLKLKPLRLRLKTPRPKKLLKKRLNKTFCFRHLINPAVETRRGFSHLESGIHAAI